ncbi:MAG: hypothetical protein ACRDJC_04430 [Thermomicrobiales bacterium]
MTRLDEFLSIASRRMSRRQAGVAGAALLALLTGVDLAEARKRKRNAKRERPQPSQGQNAISRRRRRCGGIAGIPCPEGFTCVDDPRDDCDPKRGGADCIGICVRQRKDPCAGIACEPCGRTTCPPGQVCCNASCGICTDPGMACIMIACDEIEAE